MCGASCTSSPGAESCSCSQRTSSLAAGDPEYLRIVDELRDLHALKSGGYGTGVDPFANFSAIATVKSQPRFVYPLDRDFEKSARCYSLLAQGRVSELEEEFLDKASLMVCAAAMLRADR